MSKNPSKKVTALPEAEKITLEKLQQWIVENRGFVAGVAFLVVCLCCLFMQCVFWESNRAQYGLLERQIIEQLSLGQDAQISQLGAQYKKQPALHKVVDPYLLEHHFQQEDVVGAKGVAMRMFAQIPESLDVYVQFSKATLAIQAQDYSAALEQTSALRKCLEESHQEDSQLFRFCALRESWLHKRLGEREMAEEVLVASVDTQKHNEPYHHFKESLSHCGITLIDYIRQDQ